MELVRTVQTRIL